MPNNCIHSTFADINLSSVEINFVSRDLAIRVTLSFLFSLDWTSSRSSELLFWVAGIHISAAIVIFIIVHVYLLTVGHALRK